jgi:hypothetical protein
MKKSRTLAALVVVTALATAAPALMTAAQAKAPWTTVKEKAAKDILMLNAKMIVEDAVALSHFRGKPTTFQDLKKATLGFTGLNTGVTSSVRASSVQVSYPAYNLKLTITVNKAGKVIIK